MLKKLTISLVAVLALQGCVSDSFKDAMKESSKVKEEIDISQNFQIYDQAISIEIPPYQKAAINNIKEPEWLNERLDYNLKNGQLTHILQQLLEDTQGEKKQIIYGEGIDPAKIVSLRVVDGTMREAFNLLTVKTDYGFIFEENTVRVERFINKSFSINLPPGVYDTQLGSQGEESEDGQGAVKGQFINVTIDKKNLIEDIKKGVDGILTDVVFDERSGKDVKLSRGTVSMIDGLSFIRVKTSPKRMRKVDDFIEEMQNTLNKQAVLEYRVLEFRHTNGEERAADLNLVRDVGEGTLKFFNQGGRTLANVSNYGLGFSGVNGWDGTTAFIRALEKQGQVSISTPITQLALNNIPVRVTQTKIIPYNYSIKTTVEDGITQTDIERKVETEGVDFGSIGNVQDEHIFLRVSGKLRSIVDDRTERVNEIQLRYLTARDSTINFTGKLSYGRTYIISRVSQERVKADQTKNFNTVLGSNIAETEQVETLILLKVGSVQE
ncbi:hypothetical protein OPW39_15815 [Vibrio europaeus]|uniref:hypothetical protein n=1 Tax=Vibrio europaeus TaxID=300876 RepID=UPI00233EC61A|nr:hypothetical protein [Vibrio europaeus]MDC5870275.1 hypothetical protein [Vibrio europaeus]